MNKTYKKQKEERIINFLRDNCPENSDIIDHMVITAKKFYEQGRLNEIHLNSKSISAGLTYLIYRKIKMFKTLEEVELMFDIHRREIGKMVKRIKRKLGMKYCKEASLMGSGCILQASPESFIDTAAKKIGLSQKTIEYCHKFYKEMKKDLDYFGSNPTCISAGIIYISALINDEKKTQREVADASGITEVAIRKNYMKLVSLIGEEKLKKEINEKKSKNKSECARERIKND